MRRRQVLTGAGVLAASTAVSANAQQPAMPRVGFLIAGDLEPMRTLFRSAMAELGYHADRTVKYEERMAESASGRLPTLAASLVELNVDVIVAVLTPAIAAARQATTRIPIVFNGGAPDTGMVTNFARPEGNLTGVWGATSAVAGKSVQLFHEIKPATKALAVLLNAADAFHVPLQREIVAAGRAQNVEIVSTMLKSSDELPAAYEEVVRRGMDGVLVQPSLSLETAAALAVKHGLASVSFRREFVVAGGLMSLGSDQTDTARMMAAYVDKLLRGARPSDLPVQIPSKIELIVNQKTARALGLTLSPMFLTRADEVIE
jgi:putative ABC transport system substrate-binding protein